MKLSLYNFPVRDAEKLEKILPLSKTNHYSIHPFALAVESDLLLVYGEESLEHAAIQNLTKELHSKIVIISKKAAENSAYYHLQTPLIASRILKNLDNIVQEHARANGSTVNPSLDSLTNENQPVFNVLVVDDSIPMQRALAAEIKKLEMVTTIDFADCGEQALEKVENSHYDFIFLDIIMPGIDGFETCSKMREIPALKRIPIIMLSAKSSPLDEVKGVMAGCTTYMTKPIVHEEFQKVVRRISKWVENFSAKKNAVKVN